MPEPIQCTACGEQDALRGERRGEQIIVHCLACGHSGERAPLRACPTCGRTDLVPTRQELRDKVRGTQVAIMGVHTVYRCPACDA